MMQTHQRSLPTPETLLDAWNAWHSLIGVDKIQTEEEYDRVVAILNIVLDATRDTPSHPLEGALLYLAIWWRHMTTSIITGRPHRLLRCCAT
jgi:hypothetical protein